MTQRPNKPMLRLADVLAWQPQLTQAELRDWEELGLIHPWRKYPGARRWYPRDELEKLICGTNGNK